MNKPRLEDKNGIASVIDKEGNVVKSFSTKDHGKSYLSAAQLYLQQNYDKLMSESNDYFSRRKAEEDRIADKRDKHGAKLPPLRKPKQTDYEKMRQKQKEQGLDEEVEQMDEGGGLGTLAFEIGNNLAQHPTATAIAAGLVGAGMLAKRTWNRHKEVKELKSKLPSWSMRKLKANVKTPKTHISNAIQQEIDKRTQTQKEEVEQMDEVAPPGREKQVKALKEKVDNPYAGASYNKGKAETKSENTMLSNMLTKLEEGRGRPPKPGSEAWKRRQAASTQGQTVDETPGLGDQLLKHQDQGERGSGMIKFKDGSSHKISGPQRDKALRFMRSLVGPGKNPDVRDATIAKMSKSHEHFLQHIGEKPMQPEKLHPMSAQKE